MKARMSHRATYADLEKAPENMVAELIDGDLYMSPRPAGPHARFATALAMDIGPPYDRGRSGPPPVQLTPGQLPKRLGVGQPTEVR